MVVHTCLYQTWKRGADRSLEFQASLIYRSIRTVRGVAKRNPVSKIKTLQNQKSQPQSNNNNKKKNSGGWERKRKRTGEIYESTVKNVEDTIQPEVG